MMPSSKILSVQILMQNRALFGLKSNNLLRVFREKNTIRTHWLQCLNLWVIFLKSLVPSKPTISYHSAFRVLISQIIGSKYRFSRPCRVFVCALGRKRSKIMFCLWPSSFWMTPKISLCAKTSKCWTSFCVWDSSQRRGYQQFIPFGSFRLVASWWRTYSKSNFCYQAYASL